MDLTGIKIEDIIEIFNQLIEDERLRLKLDCKGHLILKKSSKPHSSFKSLVEYKYTLVYHYNNKNIDVLEDSMWINKSKQSDINKLKFHFVLMLIEFIRKEYVLTMLAHNTYGEPN